MVDDSFKLFRSESCYVFLKHLSNEAYAVVNLRHTTYTLRDRSKPYIRPKQALKRGKRGARESFDENEFALDTASS